MPALTRDPHQDNRAIVGALCAAMHDFDATGLRRALDRVVAPEAAVRLGHPLAGGTGPEALWHKAVAPLAAAFPDLERRDYIVMAGSDDDGAQWVGCAGYFVGVFERPFRDIPPTGHLAHMRFHEFYRLEAGRVVEIQALWDLPELMIQAGAWPMAPSLGREWCVPAPARLDGLRSGPRDASLSEASRALVVDMLTHMVRHPAHGGPEAMQMERFWHPRMSWYGPAGIGTARGIRGFRHWHQIPFLAAMPDRGLNPQGTRHHFFADGPYVAVTGWPNMAQTLSAPGWLGLPPVGRRITMRSLDFWRLEAGLIRENWVLVDLLDVYAQIGVDVLARMREFNKARCGFDPETGRAL